MHRTSHFLWNVLASLIAVVVVAYAADWLRADLQSGHTHPGYSKSSCVMQNSNCQSILWGTPAMRSPIPQALPSSWLRDTSLHHPLPAKSTLPRPLALFLQGESVPPPGESTEETGGGRKEIFLWVNFLIVVVGFWYLGKKYLEPFLQARAQAIREEMERSSNALHEAASRLSGVEDKLKRLGEEIDSLRSSALQESAAERARITEMAKAEANKIALAAEQEIAAAAKLARQELKAYAAELAIGLAEKKIQETISPEADKGIFRSFLKDLTSRPGGDA